MNVKGTQMAVVFRTALDRYGFQRFHISQLLDLLHGLGVPIQANILRARISEKGHAAGLVVREWLFPEGGGWYRVNPEWNAGELDLGDPDMQLSMDELVAKLREYKHDRVAAIRAPTKRELTEAALLRAHRVQLGICPVCGHAIEHVFYAELAHVLAVSEGGEDEMRNRVLVHGSCNRVKGRTRTIEMARTALGLRWSGLIDLPRAQAAERAWKQARGKDA